MKKETKAEIVEYFKDSEIPEIKQSSIERLKQKTENKNRINVNFRLKKIAIFASCFLVLVTAILLPALLVKPNATYYSFEDVNEEKIEYSLAEELINDTSSKYSFIFEEFSISKTNGIYSKDSNKLLGVRISGEKNDIPFTAISFLIVLNKNFIPADRDVYLQGAEKTDYKDYTLYKRSEELITDTNILSVFEFDNYIVYLKINMNDIELFEKFL